MNSTPTDVSELERTAASIAADLDQTRRNVSALGAAIHAADVIASPPLARAVQAQQNLYDRIEAEFDGSPSSVTQWCRSCTSPTARKRPWPNCFYTTFRPPAAISPTANTGSQLPLAQLSAVTLCFRCGVSLVL
jgi:hypothetical protein